jgi:hypothetical protein
MRTRSAQAAKALPHYGYYVVYHKDQFYISISEILPGLFDLALERLSQGKRCMSMARQATRNGGRRLLTGAAATNSFPAIEKPIRVKACRVWFAEASSLRSENDPAQNSKVLFQSARFVIILA